MHREYLNISEYAFEVPSVDAWGIPYAYILVSPERAGDAYNSPYKRQYMATQDNSGSGGVFSSPSFSSSFEGRYTVTDTGYLISEDGQRLFIGGSAHPLYRKGLWSKTGTGRAQYISSLKAHPSRQDTFIFDTLPDREKHLLILKEDRAVIVKAGGDK